MHFQEMDEAPIQTVVSLEKRVLALNKASMDLLKEGKLKRK